MKFFKDWPRFVAVAFPPRHMVIAVNTADLPDPLLQLFPRLALPSCSSIPASDGKNKRLNLLPDNEIDEGA